MYLEDWNWPTTTATVALNSLGWLLLGFLAGRRFSLSRKTSAKPAPQAARAQSQRQPTAGSAELYVGNLSYETTEADLREMFSKAGKVASIRLIENKFNGKSKGYAFIEMAGEEHAVEASRQLNGKEFKGRKIVVSQAKSKAR